jgi:hypothetical protein
VTNAVRLLTPREIAKTYGQSLSAVYVLAHRKKWRRIKWQGRVYYDLAEVDATLGSD